MYAEIYEQCTACKQMLKRDDAVYDGNKPYHLSCAFCTNPSSCDLEHEEEPRAKS